MASSDHCATGFRDIPFNQRESFHVIRRRYRCLMIMNVGRCSISSTSWPPRIQTSPNRSGGSSTHQRGPHRVGPTGQFAIISALVLSVILFLVGLPSAAVACAVSTGLVWLHWRYSGGLDGPQD